MEGEQQISPHENSERREAVRTVAVRDFISGSLKKELVAEARQNGASMEMSENMAGFFGQEFLALLRPGVELVRLSERQTWYLSRILARSFGRRADPYHKTTEEFASSAASYFDDLDGMPEVLAAATYLNSLVSSERS